MAVTMTEKTVVGTVIALTAARQQFSARMDQYIILTALLPEMQALLLSGVVNQATEYIWIGIGMVSVVSDDREIG